MFSLMPWWREAVSIGISDWYFERPISKYNYFIDTKSTGSSLWMLLGQVDTGSSDGAGRQTNVEQDHVIIIATLGTRIQMRFLEIRPPIRLHVVSNCGLGIRMLI